MTDPVTGTGGAGPARRRRAVAQLRVAPAGLADIAGRDGGSLNLPAVTEALADLAGYSLQTALAVAAYDLTPDAAPCRLAIIGMGKAGGRELNYVSDVDVIFVAEPADAATTDAGTETALGVATRLASATMRICDAAAESAQPRAEGKTAPCTLASHAAYYARWVVPGFRPCWLRPVAGDGTRRALCPHPGPHRLVRRRTHGLRHVFGPCVAGCSPVPPAIADRGSPGPAARDVSSPAAAGWSTAEVTNCAAGRFQRWPVCATEVTSARRQVSLADAYSFTPSDGHRVPPAAPDHIVPEQPAELRRLARAMGYRPDGRGDAREVFQAEWALHGREVRRLHEKLFYRPLLEAVARVPTEALRLTPVEARRRLAALGFVDPDQALRHIEALTAGLSRRAILQRTLLPVMLSDCACPTPARLPPGVRRARLPPWFLRLLRDRAKSPRDWRTCSVPAGTARRCSNGRPRRCKCSLRTLVSHLAVRRSCAR